MTTPDAPRGRVASVRTSVTFRALVAGACAVACAGPGVARAGQPVSDGTDTLQLEAAVHPATTAPRGKPRPVALQLAVRHTSVSGGPASALRTATFDLPAGMNVNLEPRTACRVSALVLHGARGCPARSQVGSGTAVLDARPAGRGYPLRAKVRVFSAVLDVPPPPPGVRPARRGSLVIYAFAPRAAVFLPFSHPGPRPTWLGLSGSGFTMPSSGVGVEELSVTLRAMRWPKAEGGKPLVQAPTRCAGAWHFSVDFAFFGSGLTATDDVPCRQ
jgi:hypothetical protein